MAEGGSADKNVIGLQREMTKKVVSFKGKNR